MVNTKQIRKNLGTRDSIGLKREDVLPLLDAYELELARNPPIDEVDCMRFPADFEAKH